MKLNIFMSNLLLCGLACAFLGYFVLIGMHGQYLIQEPNPVIYMAEARCFLFCIGLGLYNMFVYPRMKRVGEVFDGVHGRID